MIQDLKINGKGKMMKSQGLWRDYGPIQGPWCAGVLMMVHLLLQGCGCSTVDGPPVPVKEGAVLFKRKNPENLPCVKSPNIGASHPPGDIYATGYHVQYSDSGLVAPEIP